jgi:2-amino-4-hydroxy-6-hydroxymethyldihydropteridine diphosphokinase
MIDVFLLLGSNKGEREQFLAHALIEVASRVGEVVQRSSVYETESWGKSDEPDYLNQVLLVKTSLSARDILNIILDIERKLGRERIEKYGSRTIDIDILFYGEECINEADLIIPHPQLPNRRFTLEPLVEIAPEWSHPELHKTMMVLKNELSDDLIVKKI